MMCKRLHTDSETNQATEMSCSVFDLVFWLQVHPSAVGRSSLVQTVVQSRLWFRNHQPAPLSPLSNQMLLPWECTLQFSPERRFALSLVLAFLGFWGDFFWVAFFFLGSCFCFFFSKIATEQLFHQGTDHSVSSLYDSHLCLLLSMKTTPQ